MKLDYELYQNDVYCQWLTEEFPVILANAQPRIQNEALTLVAKDLIEERIAKLTKNECHNMFKGTKFDCTFNTDS